MSNGRQGIENALVNGLAPGFTYRVQEWGSRGLCVSMPPEIFFPGKGGGGIRRARMVCIDCPVRRECLEDAMATEPMTVKHRHGVRGGLTPTERHALAKQRRAAAPV